MESTAVIWSPEPTMVQATSDGLLRDFPLPSFGFFFPTAKPEVREFMLSLH